MNRIYISLIVLLLGLVSCNYFAAGSYPYAELYEVECDPLDLVEAVKQFKADNPDFAVPQEVGFIDGNSGKRDDHWYHIYFYYKSENKILNTWIRYNKESTSTFAFVAVKNGLQIGNWKEINNDLSKQENRLEKQKFEDRILNRVKEYLK
jgi:hypothetical protein